MQYAAASPTMWADGQSLNEGNPVVDFSSLPLEQIALIAAVLGGIALVILLRPFLCWYFKVNQRIAILNRIEQHLATLAEQPKVISEEAPSEPEQKVESERDPYLKNLSGEELEEGLKGLVLRADERIY